MPELDIIGPDGRLHPTAAQAVEATMIYPKDAERREQMQAKSLIDSLLRTDPSQPVPGNLSTVAHQGPDFARFDSDTRKAVAEGNVAGHLLFFILRCAKHSPSNATVRRAVRVMESDLEARKERNKAKHIASESRIKAAWSAYKPSCHLWATWEIFGFVSPSPDNFVSFLETAEWLREFGESHYPPPINHKRNPLLNSKETWSVPKELGIRAVAREIPSLTREEVAWLAKYFAY